jgi:hydrogenase maturation protease
MPATNLICATPPQALVLACGNPLRGDDGVSWRIGRMMQQRPPMIGLTVVVSQQLLPEHAIAVSTADLVVFVDCSAVIPPGTVSTVRLHPAESLPRIFTHSLAPSSLLRLALDLYAHAPTQAVAVTVGGESFALKDRLSMAVEMALPKALEEVCFQVHSQTPVAM